MAGASALPDRKRPGAAHGANQPTEVGWGDLFTDLTTGRSWLEYPTNSMPKHRVREAFVSASDQLHASSAAIRSPKMLAHQRRLPLYERRLAAAVDPASQQLVSEESSRHVALSASATFGHSLNDQTRRRSFRPRFLSSSEEVEARRGLPDRLPFGQSRADLTG
jgi:hypothetical protein